MKTISRSNWKYISRLKRHKIWRQFPEVIGNIYPDLRDTKYELMYSQRFTLYGYLSMDQEKFEDTIWIIRSRKAKERQHNGQRTNDKKTNNSWQNTKELKIGQCEF
jgi:hypothetical protein